MAGRGGITGVRYCDLFWRTLEPHRNESHYPGLRSKLLTFLRRKEQSLDPVSGRDNRFGATNRLLNGLWHFAIIRNPDVVIFYTVDAGVLSLAMVGSHHDYPSDGKNMTAAARTAGRVRNTVAGPDVPVPGWPSLRWSDPRDILRSPDLPELGAQALDDLLWEVIAEMESGTRYEEANGRSVLDVGEAEFERYLSDLADARDLVMQVREAGLGADFWRLRAPQGFVFGAGR